jgi:arabinose-5-phosphate isomerase
LHPAEAFHGDLGRLGPLDVVLALSNSGETGELTQILPSLKRTTRAIVSITARTESTLGKFSDVVIDYGAIDEACHLGLAPSTSTTAMIALGDALAIVTSQARKFAAEDFARFHPGGSLGKRLSTVDDLMKPLQECRIATENEIIRDIVCRSSTRRRVGVILVVDGDNALSGIFTDSDLVRLLERRQDNMLDRAIAEVMTRNPIAVLSGSKFEVALQLLAAKSISEIPVIDANRKPVGLVDITDIVGLLPSV